MSGSRLSSGPVGSVKSANGVKFAGKPTKTTDICSVTFVTVHFTRTAYVLKWPPFPKMAGNASCVASARIAALGLQAQDSPRDGMPITRFATLATSKEIKAWLAPFAGGLTGTRLRKK